jgi:hypothetical protein
MVSIIAVVEEEETKQKRKRNQSDDDGGDGGIELPCALCIDLLTKSEVKRKLFRSEKKVAVGNGRQ